jgi:hypothetical protein
MPLICPIILSHVFIDEVNDEKDYFYPFIYLIIATLGHAARAVCSSCKSINTRRLHIYLILKL